jgi:PAS domain S-box-containing protein
LAILDVDGTIYVARGWQDICTKFHRVNPHTCARCHESDAYINSRLGEGQYIEYRCKNGLWDMAAPIIIEGRHLANSYYGQIFLEEKPDLGFFLKQAEEFGFDVGEYLAAVQRVPVVSRQKARRIMDFYVGLVEFLANLGLTRSKQMKAEKSLRKSEERLRAIFESAENVSLIITDTQDPEPLILEFSPGAEKIFGYDRSDIIGKPVSILHLPEDTARFPEVHSKMREGGTGFAGETVLIRKSGEKFSALFSTYPLSDEKGKMYAGLGVSIDISKRKRLEEQLQKARKMEAMGLMAGGIAHDLNNILSGIVSYPLCHLGFINSSKRGS